MVILTIVILSIRYSVRMLGNLSMSIKMVPDTCPCWMRMAAALMNGEAGDEEEAEEDNDDTADGEK